MHITSIARRLLSFPRASVIAVQLEWKELGSEILVIDVQVRGWCRCSRYGGKSLRYDRLRPWRWRHLDFGAWTVQLRSRLWRVECDRCGVGVEQVSWTGAGARFTRPFKFLVAWLAQRSEHTGICTMLRISWRSVRRIVERVVARERAAIDWSKVRATAVDELVNRKGQRY